MYIYILYVCITFSKLVFRCIFMCITIASKYE